MGEMTVIDMHRRMQWKSFLLRASWIILSTSIVEPCHFRADLILRDGPTILSRVASDH